MATTRRTFLQAAPAASLAAGAAAGRGLDTLAIARRHAIVRDLPAPDFFEGMLLGNGDIGLCATVRPDALGLHIGKLDVWDIRVSEEHINDMLPFDGVMKLWEQASERAKREGRPDALHLENSDPALRDYQTKMRSSYAKPWPRPWPCGIVWIHWDSRKVRLLRQSLDISTGVLTVEFEENDLRGRLRRFRLECFVSWSNGHISVASNTTAPIVSVAYYPHADPKTQMPLPALSGGAPGEFVCRQLLPATAPGEQAVSRSAQDRTFTLCGRLQGAWTAAAQAPGRLRAFLASGAAQPFRLDIALFTSFERPDADEHARGEAARLSAAPLTGLRHDSVRGWRSFWSRSAVEFGDRELERIWYHNQYFLACCLKEDKVAPGLFGNWSSGNIGTAWHGDYHLNYNTQQVFWGVFSSNHVDQHLPYVKLVENLMPMAEWNARVQFGLPGVYFPHSAYPVPSNVNPYPTPPWGYQICETPWTVQSLWWHYLYTLDEHYLRRVYPILKGAADFIVAFLKRGRDGKYHVFPTVSPENWGMTVDYRLNRDCIIDLALTEFLLDAMLEASRTLGRDESARERWQEVRRNLVPYPAGEGPYGQVWLDVADGPLEHVFNVPVTLAPVFPAEQVGLDRRPELLEIARRTVHTVRLEGGNDLVWQPLARARLGMLDLNWFKREVRYCRIANGVAQDRVRQIGGRYRDETNFDFMVRMGIWTENLSLPAVLNECLLQSHAGVIRVFPNTTNLGAARFENLRAAGAFLVSAAWDGRAVTDLRILSEKGARARVASPWSEAKVASGGTAVEVERRAGIIEFATAPGVRYEIGPA